MAVVQRLRFGGAAGFAALLLIRFGFGPALAQPSLHAAMVYGVGLDEPRASEGSLLTARPRPEPVAVSVAPRDTLRDPWLGRDKVLHAAGSFLLTLSAQYVLTSKLDTSEDGALPIAAGTALSLGLAKEVADSRRAVRPLFSVRDLVADAVGVALAVGLILL
jgi:uncharacterized protein YfiM (DUF2279 family)